MRGYQKRALAAKPRIPLLYGVDSVHGNSNLVGAVIFPHNIGLGCTRNAKLVEEIGRLTAEETRATGINWAFSPCVTVPQDIRWGRTYEGFSEDPSVVAPLGAAAARGLQRDDLAHPLAVLACVKHFAGDGGTTFGTGAVKDRKTGERYPLDRGDTRGDEDELFRLHIAGYIPAIQAGAGSIMPSYSSWNGEKCSGHKRLLTDILKGRLGFAGFLISDYNALDELPGSRKEQTAQSINAGMDMVMVPEQYQQFFSLLRENVNEGKVPLSRIDDAVLRILRVKFAMGLMDPNTNLFAPPEARKAFGSAAHRDVARRAVRESVVVLKNERRVLPLAKSAKRIHVAGKSMHDLGNQCGGWTVTWQGKSGAVTTGTTVLAAIRRAAATVTSSVDGTGAEGAAVGIAVIGEKPYAEMIGDRTDLRLAPEDVAAVKNLKKCGIPVVAVVLSGRPLLIDEILGMPMPSSPPGGRARRATVSRIFSSAHTVPRASCRTRGRRREAAASGAATRDTRRCTRSATGWGEHATRMNPIDWLQQWYFEQCNDLREHRRGITIETLDNPGWLVKVDLEETAMQGVSMPEVRNPGEINHAGVRGRQDWLHCKVEGNCFVGAGGPFSLVSICETFKSWVEGK